MYYIPTIPKKFNNKCENKYCYEDKSYYYYQSCIIYCFYNSSVHYFETIN